MEQLIQYSSFAVGCMLDTKKKNLNAKNKKVKEMKKKVQIKKKNIITWIQRKL